MSASKASGSSNKPSKSKKLVDQEHHIPQKRGNGILRREIWVDSHNKVTGYNLAYINNALHGGDNGRVLGYDNAHGYHHRHYFGAVEPVDFVSFTDIENRFENEWLELHSDLNKGSKKERKK